MAKFENAAVVEDLVWSMRLADYPRSVNRATINDLFNGKPPYSEEDAEKNNNPVNVNFLESTNLASDARRQFANVFMKPAQFFKVNCDYGPLHKRSQYSATITKELNKVMKRSLTYFENLRSQFALVVLHGIGPTSWDDREHWEPEALGVEDVLVPGNTRLTMKNLPFLAIFRPYTADQLRRKITGPNVDPAWNIPLAKKMIAWAEEQRLDFGIPYSEIYSPEKMAERMKSDGGFVSGDSVPTIDAWDFYFWNDEDHEAGWNRRIVLDANWEGGVSGSQVSTLQTKAKGRDEFLYNPGKRKYASDRSEIIHFQFGDLSSSAPFKYHSVRSLGFVVFGACHVLTRMQCAFCDAVFEHLCQYFRVKSLEDVERALKINLFNRAFVDETTQFIPRAERWQVDYNLAQMGLSHLREIIGRNASSYKQGYDFGKEKTNQTATEVMAAVQSTTQLVNSALQQAYEYQKHQYYEIARRFCIVNSADADVRLFRLNCLKKGVPANALEYCYWDIEPEKVLGAGNKMVETAIAEKLMAVRPQLDPEPQREVTREYILAISDDADRANRLVPENPVKVTDSVHDAQLATGTLMQGMPVGIKTGINHVEYVEAMLGGMAAKMQTIEATGSMATREEIIGLNNIANHIGQHVAIIAQDPNEKGRVKAYMDDLGKMNNLLKGYEQRLIEQEQKNAQSGMAADGQAANAEAMAKVQSQQMLAQVKAQNTRESHAQRTAQRQTQFEMQIQQDQQRFEAEMQKKLHETQVDDAATTLTTAGELKRQEMKSNSETKSEE